MCTKIFFIISLLISFAISGQAQFYSGISGLLAMHPEGERLEEAVHSMESYTLGFGGKLVVGYKLSPNWELNVSAENVWLSNSAFDNHELASIAGNAKYYFFGEKSSKPFVGFGVGYFRYVMESEIKLINQEEQEVSHTEETVSGYPTIGYLFNPDFSESLRFSTELSYRFPFKDPVMKHFLLNAGVFYYFD